MPESSLELMQEIIEEDMVIMQELVDEEIKPLIEYRANLEKEAFNEAYKEFLELKAGA